MGSMLSFPLENFRSATCQLKMDLKHTNVEQSTDSLVKQNYLPLLVDWSSQVSSDFVFQTKSENVDKIWFEFDFSIFASDIPFPLKIIQFKVIEIYNIFCVGKKFVFHLKQRSHNFFFETELFIVKIKIKKNIGCYLI